MEDSLDWSAWDPQGMKQRLIVHGTDAHRTWDQPLHSSSSSSLPPSLSLPLPPFLPDQWPHFPLSVSS